MLHQLSDKLPEIEAGVVLQTMYCAAETYVYIHPDNMACQLFCFKLLKSALMPTVIKSIYPINYSKLPIFIGRKS